MAALSTLIRRFQTDERGVVLVLTTIAMFAIIGMVALSVDVGQHMMMRRQLQNAADAAAHAGVQDLPNTIQAVATANDYWDLNRPSAVSDSSFVVSFPGGGGSRLRVEAKAEVKYIFAPIFGVFSGHTKVVAEVALDTNIAEVVVVLDRSGSMCSDSHGLQLTCPSGGGDWEPFTQVQEAAVAFPQFILLRAEDQIGLVSYSTEATRDLALVQGTAAYQAKVMELAPAGYTNIGHAIAEAHDMLSESAPTAETIQFIVLLSDGIPNAYGDPGDWTTCGSRGCTRAYNYGRTEAQLAADDGIKIFTIGLGSGVDGSYLQELADIGDGSYIFSPTADELQAAFETIARLARLRFVE